MPQCTGKPYRPSNTEEGLFYFNNPKEEIKDICRSMITASHYGNLDHNEFDLYIEELMKIRR